MKAVFLPLFAAAALIGGTAQADEALAKAKGCLACHMIDRPLSGPTYKDIAQKYAGKKGSDKKLVDSILKGTGPAGAGWQQEKKALLPAMPPSAAVSPDEAQKLVKWILSLK